MTQIRTLSAVSLVATLLAAGAGAGEDGWFQFRGPNRDGISGETGIVRSWSEAGPKELWRVPIGDGFAALSIVDGSLYTMDADDENEYAISFDTETGKERWRVAVGALFENDYGDGPRSTPTIDGDRVYVLGSRGRLSALEATTGETIWSVEASEAFGSKLPVWAFTSAPIVEGDLLIAEVGGTGARAVAAFGKQDGEVRWTAVEDELSYSSPIAIDFGGHRQLVFLTKSRIFALNVDGDELWSSPFAPKLGITPAPPVFVEPDIIFVSASYGVGAKAVRLRAEGAGVVAEDVWEGTQMRNHFNASVALDHHLFGFDTSTLRCLDARTGERRWAKRGLGKGSLIAADGMLIVLSERGKLVLAEATPEGYEELASHQVLSGRCWTQPTLSGGRLYLRNHDELVALDLRAAAASAEEE